MWDGNDFWIIIYINNGTYITLERKQNENKNISNKF